MKDDVVKMAMLFDFYGEMLTQKQQDYFHCYYEADLSLSEISDNEGITRQGVRDVIARAEGILRDMEQKLGLVARFGDINTRLAEIAVAAREIEDINKRRYMDDQILGRARDIRRLMEGLVE